MEFNILITYFALRNIRNVKDAIAMATIIENPFIISGYESPKYFCDREAETSELLTTLRNGSNVTLTSPRRMGKTGLILHLFHHLQKTSPKITTIYIDLFSTSDIADFTKAFASAVLGKFDSNPVKVMKKLASVLKGVRPNMTVNEVTGAPKIGLDFVPGTENSNIEQVFNYLKNSGKECYIAFDEFQQIANYPEKNLEALLRTYIQNIHNVHFIFSGSQAHMLNEMFLSPKRPFYLSSSQKTIGTIKEEKYYAFASAFFNKQRRTLSKEIFNLIYQKYEGHTWYIQKIMNQLYQKQKCEINEDLVQEVIEEILRDNEYYYHSILRSYTKGQINLLKAIAKEKKVKEITSGAFINKYNLIATSSIKSALKSLLNNEIVYRSDDGYMIYDRFFGDWLSLL